MAKNNSTNGTTKKKQRAESADAAQSRKKSKEQSEAMPWLKWSPIVIVLAVVLVYAKVTGFNFIGLDDTTIIRDKIYQLQHLSFGTAFKTDAFLQDQGSFYRPLQTLSFMWDARGTSTAVVDPFRFHLSNLIVYIFGCLSIYWLLVTLQYKRLSAFLITLLYSVHPLFVSTVAWIPSRGDVFLTIFTVLSLIFFIRSYRKGDVMSLVLHGLSLFMAYLSKETAAAIPILCVATYFMEFRKTAPWTTLIKFVAIWIPVTGIWLALHSQLHTVENAGNLVGIGPFIANIQTIPETFGKFFVPMNFKLIPLFNSTDTIIGVIALVLVAGVVTWRKAWTDMRVLLGLFWFFLFITPVMLYRKEDAQYMFDYLYHRSFIASIGLVIAMAQLLRTAFQGKSAPVVMSVFGALSVGFAFISMSEVGYYTDGATFFSEAAVRTPTSSMCYNNIGLAKRLEGDYRGAVTNFSKAIAIQNNYSKAYINRGGMYFMLNELDSAYNDFSRAIDLDPSSPDAFSNRCAIEQRMKKYDAALADIDVALSLNPYYSDGFQNRGVVKNSLHRYADAIQDFNQSITINPSNAQAYYGRGFSKLNLQDKTGACEDWSTAAAMGLKDAERTRQQYCQ